MRGCSGVPQHLAGRALLDDLAVVEEDDAIGDLTGEPDLVRDDDERRAVAGEPADDVEHLADELGVERRRRLVEEQHLRRERERPGDRDALLLAARELPRVVVGLVGEPDAGEQPLGQRARVLLREPLVRDRRLDDVLDRREVREQVEVLEDEPDLGAPAQDLGLAQLVQGVAPALVADVLRRRP